MGQRVLRTIPLDERLFHGVVSVQRIGVGYKPWRIPYEDVELFPPNGLNGTAERAAGIRLALRSNTRHVFVHFADSGEATTMDCVIDNQLITQARANAGETRITFHGLPAEEKTIEIYMPQYRPITITGVEVDQGASFSLYEDDRPRWVTYGSSITECDAAESPALTWPAIVARRANVHLTCLGFGGNCHMEPMVATMIRDLPADYISLCVGINVWGGNSLSPRTFQSSVIGLIRIIREGHRDIPMAVISPIYSPEREIKDNATGLSLVKMRNEIEEAVSILQRRGDQHLHYFNGLELFNEQHVQYLPDRLHPNEQGYQLLADRYEAIVWNRLKRE